MAYLFMGACESHESPGNPVMLHKLRNKLSWPWIPVVASWAVASSIPWVVLQHTGLSLHLPAILWSFETVWFLALVGPSHTITILSTLLILIDIVSCQDVSHKNVLCFATVWAEDLMFPKSRHKSSVFKPLLGGKPADICWFQFPQCYPHNIMEGRVRLGSHPMLQSPSKQKELVHKRRAHTALEKN